MGFQEKLLEGKYNYYQNGHIYCEEHFKVFREESKHGNYSFQAELMSRVDTGEFLKIYVDYELNHHFEPLNVKVKRSLGGSKSTEKFSISAKDKNLRYTFQGVDGSHEQEKIVTGKHHIATPAFSTSMLMTQHRKIDPVHRTAYDVLTSNNIWSYESPYHESTVHIELMKLEPVNIRIQGHELQATHCNIYETDKFQNPGASGYPVYVSKYYQIPYLAEFPNGIRIEIERLKNFESGYSNVFKS